MTYILFYKNNSPAAEQVLAVKDNPFFGLKLALTFTQVEMLLTK